MRLALFDTIDQEGWPTPVEIRIDAHADGSPDVVICTDPVLENN
jgi:hypothetical protein